MKKILAFTLALTSLSSIAATTGTLVLKGVVASKISIEVTPATIASSLPLETSQTNTKVASVREKSNSSSGYKVTISSANLGNLKSGAESFAYTLSYDGAALNLASPVVQTHSSPASVNAVKDVTISYTGVPAEDMVAGDYTDSVTFTIAAN
ncbi:MAG: fimbrial protein [Bdellovibrionales bacterium]|nr:fimbrial protein [Bdellovibrionales bacterium]